MDLKEIITNADPNVVIFLSTTLIAFISWLVKSLVEKPIADSKNTFNKFIERRIEILTEVKSRLNFIAYFPEGNDSLEYKEQLQSIILKDGKTGYLSKEIFDSILKISIDPATNEVLLLSTIERIDEDLYLQISKIQDEITFYRKFSNYNPLRRFIGLTLLSLQYIISLSLVVLVLFLLIDLFSEVSNYIRIGILILLVFGLHFIDKWLKK
ncbi:hypothetical protein SAMN05443667_105121 [Flavobacterium gillisiae]|uniref:Uncharacterized protein n=1 Tax=Flavobacterium gillisiae TaxID=150146 RepID=A0A1H4BXQ4_9FLAO|nr:hypothetical protein [Flavobacterium gillisiae]SEA52854.1 hypothetical protein SAMN05443667_105121 [Flavobacterium gillisiae]